MKVVTAPGVSGTRRLVWVIGLVAGCQTYDDSVTRSFRANWKGQPVRSFAEYRSLVPAGHHDTPSGRTYIFNTTAPLGNACGITIYSVIDQQRGEYVIDRVATNCPGLLL